MVIALRPDVRERLDAIEREDGIPVLDQIVQAVEVWSHLTGPERHALGIIAMQLVAARARGGLS
ncbi:hypothetical protein GCM10011390_03440 [Aureimonas endophytica]|uniref:Uncharacterized protein n=1 Tax=Aureimonas endophytica TaxID=2027858 RepID=A0A916ZCA1_9HYPH|nr:hypothetical protein [Aureimonas endophytica]GGD87984.1 hypothetical protein GCM10011390_03440 [Aureimonas endophytica]